MKTVVVGSTNPVKVAAARQAFEKVWPDETWEVSGISVGSDVADQPMSDDESIAGARNRARKLLEMTAADFVVGIEGGVHQLDDLWFNCGWMVVIRREDMVEGIGSSARIMLSQPMVEALLAGDELGNVADKAFGKTNIKQNEGHFGLMTNGLVTRTSGYADGLIFALSRFLKADMF